MLSQWGGQLQCPSKNRTRKATIYVQFVIINVSGGLLQQGPCFTSPAI